MKDVVHRIQYVDMYDLNNDTYVELWGIHPSVPSELTPCNLATIVEASRLTDYDVRLPDYADFRFD